jgi:D-xylose transport system substrate-binding protein
VVRNSTARRVGGVAVAVTLAMLVPACGGGGAETPAGGGGGDKKLIAFLLPESKTTRYEQQDRPNFERKVKELCSECEIFYANADQDATKQQQQAESAITKGANVMVLDAVDVTSAAAIVARAKQSNIPVISYGRLVANADLDYYVSIDPFKVGQQQARALVDALKGTGKATPSVVAIHGSPTDSNAGPYKKGARSVLDAAGVKVVKEYDTPDWSPDRAQREMEQAITAVGANGFDGVYVANDGMAGGVIAALKGAGIDPATRPLTGQDAELAGVQRVLAGEQLMTVFQPIKQIAETSATLAVALARGQTPPDVAKAKVNNGAEDVPSALLDTVAVTKDNVAETVIADGFLTAAQICTGQYQRACQAAGIKTP